MIEDFNLLYEYIYDLTGLIFPSSNRRTMDVKLEKICQDKKIPNKAYIDLIKRDNKSLQDLLDLLTVNESYFFREMAVINEMVSRIMSQKSKVRILCAPSSSGEESFSIVMTLLKAGMNASNIDIIGIDINSEVIATAQKGLYSKRRVHKVSPEDKERFFTPVGDDFLLCDEVRSCVTFKKLNIFENSLSSLKDFDIVFSRNMLIYFDKESSLRAEKVFYNALKPQGTLLVGHADFIANQIGFTLEVINGHAFYKKS